MSRIWTRRNFIRSAAAAPLGLPFLSHFAKAQDVAPRRVIFLMSPNDAMRREDWGIGEQGSDVALPAMLPSFLAPLSDFGHKLTVVGDLYKAAEHESHCPGSLLTGSDTIDGTNATYASSISLDQYLAQQLGVQPATFGVRCVPNDAQARWSSLGANQPVDPIMDPAVAFDQYFGDFQADPAELEAKRKLKKSVLDRVAGDLEQFQSGLAAEQRPRLEAHLDAVRNLEAEIDDIIVQSCDPGSPIFGQDNTDNSAVPTTLKGLIDTMVQVMACDVTRVGTLQFGRSGGGEMAPTWPEAGINIDRDFHFGLAHRFWEDGSPEAVADRLESETWVCQNMVRYLLGELEAREDVDGRTLLDNTLVVWMHEMGSNHNAGGHMDVVAGATDVLTPGRFKSFNGRNLNDLLTAVAQMMDVDIDTFGTPAYNEGPLPL